MAFVPISGIVPQVTENGNQANGMVLKFYEPGTLTPLAVGIDSTGATQTTEFLLSTEGYTTLSGNEEIPHVDQIYKIVLYLNQSDANANDTGSAVYVIDDIDMRADIQSQIDAIIIELDEVVIDLDGVVSSVRGISLSNEILRDVEASDLGNIYITSEYNTGSGIGGGQYELVSSNPGFPLINPAKADGSGFFLRHMLSNGTISVDQAGAEISPAASHVNAQECFDYALSIGSKVVFPKNEWDWNAPVTQERIEVDYLDSIINSTIAGTEFALFINSSTGTNNLQPAKASNLILKSTQVASSAPAESEFRHGICLARDRGILIGMRIENFSGISLGLGGDTVYGTTMPGIQCFYWDISSINVSSMYGVNYYVGISNNANNFRTCGAFPFNGFNQSPPRDQNCIYEWEVHGIANTFDGINFEAAPLLSKLFVAEDISTNAWSGVSYFETNNSYKDPTGAMVKFDTNTSGNHLPFARYSGGLLFMEDLGNGNVWRRMSDFHVNSSLDASIQGVENQCANPNFNDAGGDLTDWVSFSTGVTSALASVPNGGFYQGNSATESYTNGKPGISYDIADKVFNLDSIKGKTITCTCMVKTDIAGVRIELANQAGRVHTGDDTFQKLTTTALINSTASNTLLQIDSNLSNLTGTVEISDFMLVIGTTPYSP